jgi:hypothetical protein
MNDKFYIKKNGKYVSHNDPYALDGLTNGVWIVVVGPNSKSCRRKLNAKHAELDGALEYLHEGLCKAMCKAGEIKSRSVKMSPKELRAWKAYDKIIGKDKPSAFCFASYSDIADSACEYIRKILIENGCNVKKIKEKYEVKAVSITALDRLEI